MEAVYAYTNAHLINLCSERVDLEINARQIKLHAKHPILIRLRALRIEIEATIRLLHMFKTSLSPNPETHTV